MDDRLTWLREAAATSSGSAGSDDEVRARVVAGVAVTVARRCGIRLGDLALLSAWGAPSVVDLPAGVEADPWLPGLALEVLVGDGERRRRGAHHTPRDLAAVVTALALGDASDPRTVTVCDPAVGGGAFLLAAGEALVAAGLCRRAAARRLCGVDVDPLAVAVTEAALWLWAGGGGAVVEVADALTRLADAWGAPTTVLGNPPFLGQLRTATARRPDRSDLRPELAALAGPYTDTAALFAALGTSVVAPGGRVALVLPRSFLVARDAGAARAASIGAATLEHLWLPGRQLFGAAVDVCVPVWRRAHEPGAASAVARLRGPVGGARGAVGRSVGVPATPVGSGLEPEPHAWASWSHLLAGLPGDVPVPCLGGLQAGGVLADHAMATAGFRDQFYGLRPFVVDDPDGRLDDRTHAPLVTSGLIDPAASAWGRRPSRYAGRRWEAARIDVEAVMRAGGALARWTTGKRVPKLLVAAQTRTIEAVADVDGTWLPSTPVATVVPVAGMSWHVLAVLLSPVAAAWALSRQRGSGLSAAGLRLPPSVLRALPCPSDQLRWDEAATAVQAASGAAEPQRRALLTVAGRSMCGAYGIDAEATTGWWVERLPPHPAGGRTDGHPSVGARPSYR